MRARSQFEPRPRPPGPRRAAPPLYPAPLPGARYPEGYFGGNQLPGCSIGLSPLRPGPRIDLHVRTPAGLPRGFPRARPAQAQFTAFRVAPAPLAPSPGRPLRRLAAPGFRSRRACSPWSVFQDGPMRALPRSRVASAPPVSRLFTPLPWRFSSFPRGTSPLSDSHPYLAFDGPRHPSACAPAQPYSRSAAGPTGLSPSPARVPPRFAPAPPLQLAASPRRLPPGLFPLRSPLLRESSLISSPPFTDMLKSKGSSCARPQARACRARRAAFGDRARPALRAAFRAPPRPSSPWEPRDPPAPLSLRIPPSRARAARTAHIHARARAARAAHPALPRTDPSAGSPTETLLRLLPNLDAGAQTRAPSPGRPS